MARGMSVKRKLECDNNGFCLTNIIINFGGECILWALDSEVSRLDSAFCEISAASSLGNLDGDGDGGGGSSGTMNGIASLGGIATVWGSSTMRASQSDSSLARWKSFETLNRRGLSDTALGLSRIVGTSRLLKFLQTPLYDSDSRSTSSTPTPSEFCLEQRT